MQHDPDWLQRALTSTQAIQQLPPEILQQALAQYLAQQTLAASNQLSAQQRPIVQGEIVPVQQSQQMQHYQPQAIQPRFTDDCVGGNCPQPGQQPLIINNFKVEQGGTVHVHHHWSC